MEKFHVVKLGNYYFKSLRDVYSDYEMGVTTNILNAKKFNKVSVLDWAVKLGGKPVEVNIETRELSKGYTEVDTKEGPMRVWEEFK